MSAQKHKSSCLEVYSVKLFAGLSCHKDAKKLFFSKWFEPDAQQV